MMKRSGKNQCSRRHAIAKMLVALVAVVAIVGPTLLVVTDAWAKGPGSGAGTPGGAGNSGGATGGPGASGGGGNSGGGNGTMGEIPSGQPMSSSQTVVLST